jgi:hypothetical protein
MPIAARANAALSHACLKFLIPASFRSTAFDAVFRSPVAPLILHLPVVATDCSVRFEADRDLPITFSFSSMPGMCYKVTPMHAYSVTHLPAFEEKREGLRGMPAGQTEVASSYCPSCSTHLESKSCKLICRNCGYYMSCSDFY